MCTLVPEERLWNAVVKFQVHKFKHHSVYVATHIGCIREVVQA